MVGGMEAAMPGNMDVEDDIGVDLETMVAYMSNGLTDWVDMNGELEAGGKAARAATPRYTVGTSGRVLPRATAASSSSKRRW